jgi:hypothetical protein
LDNYDADIEGDEFCRVSSSFVSKVVALLDDEHEDELKALLRETYAMDDETVSFFLDTRHSLTVLLLA